VKAESCRQDIFKLDGGRRNKKTIKVLMVCPPIVIPLSKSVLPPWEMRPFKNRKNVEHKHQPTALGETDLLDCHKTGHFYLFLTKIKTSLVFLEEV